MKGRIILIFISLSFILSNCKKDRVETFKIIEFKEELKNFTNYKIGSWWVYIDSNINKIIDTIYLVNIRNYYVNFGSWKYTDDTIFKYKYLCRAYQLGLKKDSTNYYNPYSYNDYCNNLDIKSQFDLYFISNSNTMIYSPNADLNILNYDYDTLFFQDSIDVIYNNFKINKPAIISFPLEKNYEYYDECSYYKVLDYFDNIIIQNKSYDDVYLVESYTQIESNHNSSSETGYLYLWFNKDYGIIKFKVIKDTLIKTIELVDAKIIKD